ncbi:MAG: DUF3100 domain-containing protein [Anaerotignaceae bacterium]
MDNFERTKKIIKNLPLHLTCLLIVIVCESVGIIKIPVGNSSIMLLPMLFAMVIGMIVYVNKPISWINEECDTTASQFVVVGVSLLIAKMGITSGASIENVIQAGPALIFQELGNLGTIFFALPVALFFGFKRESIGLTYSIAREPNVAVIANKYTLDSPEGRGVMITYTVGTLIGTIFVGLLASLLAMTPLHPYAIAMACGVGSGSMMAASSGTLIALFPEMAEQISAYAATSNILSNIDGVVMAVLVSIPLTNTLYKHWEPIFGRRKKIKEDKNKIEF